jgi:integrase
MEKLTAAVQSRQYELPQDLRPRERAARQYCIDAFRSKMPSLIPFALENRSVLKIATYLLNYTTGSKATLYQYVFGVHRFSKWLGKTPDEMVRDSILDRANVDLYLQHIEDFIGDLRAQDLAPGTINNHIKGVKALFNINGVILVLPHKLSKRVKYPDRAPSPEELTKILDLADIREKVIVSLLALGGFRVGTLVKLRYRHIKKDLEEARVPIHIHIEAEITKGMYHDYDTFLGTEAAQYLKAYLGMRRTGTGRLKPETITVESPLIRDAYSNEVKPLTPGRICHTVNSLYIKAGLITPRGLGAHYPLRTHSIRKYFRTQLGALNTMSTDYIEYMMGHSVSTYNDIQMKGVEFLRNLYALSGLCIRPKTMLSKIERAKTFLEALGVKPEELLSRDALTMPHRTVLDPEQRQMEVLNQALKQAIIRELRST